MFPSPTLFKRDSDERDRPIDLDVAWFRHHTFRFGYRVPCFWCGKWLGQSVATVEHVIQRSRGGTSRRDNLEIACRPCNESRAALSQLAGRIRSVMQNRNRISTVLRKVQLRRLLVERESLLPMLLDLERLYYQKLSGRRLRVCLRELDEVLGADIRRA